MLTHSVVIGRVAKPHGVRGGVSIQVHTDEPRRRFRVGAVVRAEHSQQPLTLASVAWPSGRLVVSFVGLTTRDAVEPLVGVWLAADVPADETPDDPDEYYDRQLIGLDVQRPDGAVAGRVVDVTHGGAQDLLVVRTSSGDKLVPFVAALVPLVDVAAGRLVVADYPGLLFDEPEH